MRVPPRKGERMLFFREKKEVGRAIGNKERMAFLLAKSLPERVFLFPVGYIIVTGYNTQLYILRFLFINFFTLVKHQCTFNTTGYIVFGENM